MASFEHSGITQHYEMSGAGPPLLLLAGMLSDSASWAPVAPLLEPHFTLIRPDNRTTGRTVPLDAPASVSLFAADCAAVLKHADVGPAHVMGHSLGGMIGWELACDHHEMVKTLTLAASAPVRLERNVALFKNILTIRQSNAPADAWLRALFPWLFAPSVYEISGAVEQAATAALAYPFAQTTSAMAHQISALEGYAPDTQTPPQCPTQALLAADDLIMPSTLAIPALGNIPNHVIPSAGHSIHWDAPDAVAQHLLSFVQQHEDLAK